jgi:hypothetical protein
VARADPPRPKVLDLAMWSGAAGAERQDGPSEVGSRSSISRPPSPRWTRNPAPVLTLRAFWVAPPQPDPPQQPQYVGRPTPYHPFNVELRRLLLFSTCLHVAQVRATCKQVEGRDERPGRQYVTWAQRCGLGLERAQAA